MKIVCTNCQCEYVPDVNGVVVIEYASFGPYKVWNADRLKCPGCGHKIVAGFAQQPIREDHYVPSFAPWLKSVIDRAPVVVNDYEYPRKIETPQEMEQPNEKTSASSSRSVRTPK